jgi:hypothetical protein
VQLKYTALRSLKSHRDPADSRSCISSKVGMTLLFGLDVRQSGELRARYIDA